MRRLAVVIAGLLLVAGPAASQRISIGLGLGLTFVGGVAGPIDPIGAPASAAYSFRLLRQGYLGTGAAVRLRRASDNAESDIGFSGSGGFDAASATTFCNATSCFVKTWYDQSGNGRDVFQATAANQPALVLNCIGALPCLQMSTSPQQLQTASNTLNTVSPISGSTVGNRSASAGAFCVALWANNNQLYADSVAGTWTFSGASGAVSTAAADNAWHAITGVINGAASVLRADAVETTGTVTATAGFTAVQAPRILTVAGPPCSMTETVLWNGYALTAAERTALTANQRAYFGF